MSESAGEINVELRLLFDKLKQDIKAAAAEMNAGLNVGVKGSADGADKAGKAMDDLTKKTRKATDAVKDHKKAMLEAWRASLPTPKVIDASGSLPKASGIPANRTAIVTGSGLATQVPGAASVTQKIPPIIPKAPAVAGGGGFSLQNLAQMAGVVTGIASSLYLLKQALNLVLVPIRALTNQLRQAYDAGRQLYISSVRSGGGMGFASTRGALARTLGVSEDEVYSFSKALQYMNARLGFAAATMAKSAPSLTATSLSLRAMGESIKAAFADMGAAVGPAIQQFADMVTQFVKFFTELRGMKDIGLGLNAILRELNGILMTGVLAFESFVLGLQGLVDAIGAAGGEMARSAKFWGALAGGANMKQALGAMGEKQDYFKESRRIAKLIDEQLAAFGRDGGKIGDNSANTKRMSASAWERMGLVIGGTGAENHARETARNTKEMVALMKKFVSVTPGGGLAGLALDAIYPKP